MKCKADALTTAPIAHLPASYYARFRVSGKLIWKSLKSDKISVAQLRFADMQKAGQVRAAAVNCEAVTVPMKVRRPI